MINNGIFMSKLAYLIQLWGGTSGFLLKALQFTQNRAARGVTKSSWFTPTRILMRQCNWQSVKQLVFYHTILTTHKVVLTGKPEYLHDKICREHTHIPQHQDQCQVWGELWWEVSPGLCQLLLQGGPHLQHGTTEHQANG